MKSRTLPSFWEKYRRLDKSNQERTRKAFKLWIENPFHPSLHFKCINTEENIWAVRINLGYRILGVLDEDTVTWFWVGSHDEYEKYFG
jgi:mRNA-degrading endonuclease RelE of RelBE toxin-antitoxin system